MPGHEPLMAPPVKQEKKEKENGKYIHNSIFPFIYHFFRLNLQDQKGTIHLRRRQIFMIFDPYPLPSAF